jgi:hypothetical protein
MDEYINRKKQINMMYGEDTVRGLILEKEGFTKKRESYLKKLEKKDLIQILLSIEFGNTKGYEPVEIKKKSKKGKGQDDED